tara:strand:- start:328 stop:1536 length:1209 start_codon:yes stop_codon:yes gene_type:complete
MSDTKNKFNPALNGIKVLDLTRVLGGPYATQILADHGAIVTKVESHLGDEVREWGPPFTNGMASYFINVNRNKRSIAMDLKETAGKEILFKLLEQTDILIENFKTGTMEKWGLGYEEILKNKFPKLIHCRISGFGAKGPLGGAPGYDAIVQAMTGMMTVNGTPESGNVRMGAPFVDMGTGLYSTIGILMALHERNQSNQGQFIDMTLYDSALALMHPHNANFFLSGKAGKATGNSHPNISPYDKFKTATNEIFMGIGNDAGFARLCNALNLTKLVDDERFKTNGDRVKNRLQLTKYLEKALSNVDGVEFSEKLLSAGVPAGPVRNIEEAIKHGQTKERKMVIEKDFYTGIASPIKFSRSENVGIKHTPPAIGEHSTEILKELGYSDQKINQFLKNKVVSTNT